MHMHLDMISILPTDRQSLTSWKIPTRMFSDNQMSHIKAVLFPRKEINKKQKSSDKAYTKDWYDKEKCKNITCYNCIDNGHPEPYCPKGDKKPAAKSSKSNKKDDNDNRRSRKSSSNSAVVAKMEKDMKSQSCTFTTLKYNLQEMEE